MSEVYFYHVTKQTVASALPQLLAKSIDVGWTVFIRGKDEESLKLFDDTIWTAQPESFIPHAMIGSQNEQKCDILLGTKENDRDNIKKNFKINVFDSRELILNAIRDNEDKAEAMGIETMKYKIIGWMVSAFFCGLAGGIMGGLVGYIDSTDVAFDGREMGVFMVLMAILGGKGTLWGPVIGATLFHFFKEGLWTLILGWQYVALGVLIVVIVVYFPEGLMGWLREKYPERFGEVIDDKDRKAQVELK